MQVLQGVDVGLDKWDGSDFFTASDSFGIIIVKKVAHTLQSNKITNMSLISLQK
jgi:hypothetical protein